MSNTTLMKPTDELFTDLAPAQAEVIQGGWNFEGYDWWNLGGKRLAAANFALPKLKYPNDISSVRIRRGKWALYDEPYYVRLIALLGPGVWNLTSSNNRTESLRRVG
jgi:hypothetical protein